jgi:hypothetical protein
MDEHVPSYVFSPRLLRGTWLAASARGLLAALWHRFAGNLGSRYRPERHYMRGPGPKWHERNSGRPEQSTIEDPA